jgi:LruC domain-containing protein
MKQRIFLLILISSVALFYQNCAKINYADDGNISKDLINGVLDDGGGNNDHNVKNIKMSVAFEDLMTMSNYSNQSDVDYNDFVMTYNVREESENGFLKKIEIDIVPQAREASYEAQLILSLQGALANVGKNKAVRTFLNSSSVVARIDYYDQDDQITSSQSVDVTKPIVVFKKTSEVFVSQNANLEAGTSEHPIKVLCKEKAKVKAKITIVGFTEDEKNRARSGIELSRYPFYLYVQTTQVLMGTVDIHPTHKTKDGYPLAFQLPGTYLHPADRVNIRTVYPYFDLYLKYINSVSITEEEISKAMAWSDWITPDWSKKLACSPVVE